jgi:hypothetical protein
MIARSRSDLWPIDWQNIIVLRRRQTPGARKRHADRKSLQTGLIGGWFHEAWQLRKRANCGLWLPAIPRAPNRDRAQKLPGHRHEIADFVGDIGNDGGSRDAGLG